MTPDDDPWRGERLRDGTLPPAEAAAWAAALVADPARRAAVAEDRRTAAALATALAGDPAARHRAVAAAAWGRMRRDRARWWSIAGALAATLLVAASAWWALGAGPEALPPGWQRITEDRWRDDAVALRFAPGATAHLDGSGTELRLTAGTVAVFIDAGEPRPFAITGPHARILAEGTGFTVGADPGATTVRVDHGRVRVERAGAMRVLGPGEIDTGGADADLSLATRLAREPSAVPGAPAAILPGIQDPALAGILADRFGFPVVIPFDARDPGLRHPGLPVDGLLAAARGRPAVVLIERLVHVRVAGDAKDLPRDAVLRDPAGSPVHFDDVPGEPLLSPLAPEAHLAEVGRAIGAELRRQVGGAGVVPAMVCWRTRLPLPLGDGAVELYRRDPAVAAAMAAAEAAGEPATAWVARHQGRVERLVRDAARDAAGFGAAVPWAELGGGWQPDQGRWAGWPGSVADATRRQLGETLSFPSMAGHDWAHRDGGGTPADDLTRLLAQVAGGQRLGVVRVLPMVPAWDPEPLPGWTAVLAMLGADGVVVEDPALAALRADDRSGAVLPPALHRALALTRWLVDLRADHPGFTDWPLVAADEPHPYRADSPILPLWRLLVAGDAGAVVIARRRPDGAVLVLGWAPDGRDRTVRVDLPGRPGTVVRCSPLGAVRLLPTP